MEGVGTDDFRAPLIELAIDGWKFTRTAERFAGKLELAEQARMVSQVRFFLRRIEQALETGGLRLVSLEGQAFEPGMAATALNMAEFDGTDGLVVDQMLEPVVMGPSGVVRLGAALVRKGP